VSDYRGSTIVSVCVDVFSLFVFVFVFVVVDDHHPLSHTVTTYRALALGSIISVR
jgi:hypothetical protein